MEALLVELACFFLLLPLSCCFSLFAQLTLLLCHFIARGGGVGGGSGAGLGTSSRLGWIGCWFDQIGVLVFSPFPLHFSSFLLFLLLFVFAWMEEEEFVADQMRDWEAAPDDYNELVAGLLKMIAMMVIRTRLVLIVAVV
jgi:hypothetical protein